MRTYGEIAGVSFNRLRWSVYHLATEYRLYDGESTKLVYVNTMLELKEEIRNFIWEEYESEEG